MPEIADDPVTKLAFSIQQNKGVYALLLGSGLSLSAGIPTGWAITVDLIRKLALTDGVAEQSNWKGWYKTIYGREPDYSHLLERLAPNPAERQPIIQAYLEPARDPDDPEDRRGLPTLAHQAIARLVKAGHIKVIITTNFDRLLETALTAEGIQPSVIAAEDDCTGAIPLPHSRCTIVTLHGDLLDVRSLNTADELARYPKKMDRLLDRILEDYGLIICGWSCTWDRALRSAIRRAPSRRYTIWWAAYQGKMEKLALSLAKHRCAERFAIAGADEFFQELAVKVETFTRLKQPPPATTALVVAMAKRYLQRPEHRIDLADLVQRETDRLLAAMGDILAQEPSRQDRAAFWAIRDRCEVAVEALASVLGVLGRWGADDPAAQQLGLASDAIRRCLALWSDPDNPQHHRSLSAYPPLYLFHAYGLGLVQARRWQALWDFLLLPLGSRRQWPVNDDAPGQMRMAEAFLLRWWLPLQINGNGFYAEDITGERLDDAFPTAPVTDHVWQRMQSWIPRFLGDVADHEILHERLLVYAAYALFSGRPERIKDGKYQEERVGIAVPSIRIGSFRSLIDELREASHAGNGFGPQDASLFAAFKSNLRHAGKFTFAF
jgi:hypothetical protein